MGSGGKSTTRSLPGVKIENTYEIKLELDSKSQAKIDSLTETNQRLNDELIDARDNVRMLQEELERVGSTGHIRELEDQIEELDNALWRAKEKIIDLAASAETEFKSALRSMSLGNLLNDELDVGNTDMKSFARSLFYDVQEGLITSTEALDKFRSRYADVLSSGKSDGNILEARQFEMFAEKLETALVKLEEIRTKINGLADGSISVKFKEESEELETGVDKEIKAIDRLKNKSDDINDIATMLAALASPAISEGSSTTAYESITSLVRALHELEQESDPSKIKNISTSLKSLADLNGAKFNISGIEKIISAFNTIKNVENGFLNVKLDLSGIERLSGTKISSTWKNVSEYFNPISALNIDKLQQFANINWEKLSGFTLKKSSMQGLAMIAEYEKEIATLVDRMNKLEVISGEMSSSTPANATSSMWTNLSDTAAVVEAATKRMRDDFSSTGDSAEKMAQEMQNAFNSVGNISGGGGGGGNTPNSPNGPINLFGGELELIKTTVSDIKNGTKTVREFENGLKSLRVTVTDTVKTSKDGKEEKTTTTTSTRLKSESEALADAVALIEKSGKKYDTAMSNISKQKGILSGLGIGEDSDEFKKLTELEDKLNNLFKSLESGVMTGDGLGFKGFNAGVDAINREINSSASNVSALKKTRDEAVQVEKELEQLASKAKEVTSMKLSLDNMSTASVTGSDSYSAAVADVEKYKAEIESLEASLRDGSKTPDEYAKSVAKLGTEMKKTAAEISKLNSEDKKKTTDARTKIQVESDYTSAISKATDALNKYTKAENSNKPGSKQAYSNIRYQRDELERLFAAYNNGEIELGEFKEKMDTAFASIKNSSNVIKKNGDDVQSFGDRIQGVASKFGIWLSTASVFMYVQNAMREMIRTSVELDSAITQLKIVTDETDATYSKFADSINSTAQKLSVSAVDLTNATTTYARLGYNLEESQSLAELTTQLQAVGDIEAQDAQDAVTAIVKAFNVDIADVENVMDKLVIVGNSYPISVSQIAEGMNNASSMLAVATGNTAKSFDESVTLLTAANTTIDFCRVA